MGYLIRCIFASAARHILRSANVGAAAAGRDAGGASPFNVKIKKARVISSGMRFWLTEKWHLQAKLGHSTGHFQYFSQSIPDCC
jgi:hypothetical protein